MDIPIQPNMTPVLDIKLVSKEDRLFYELGYKVNSDLGYGNNWAKTGIFREIHNIEEFIYSDKLLNNSGYLKHHNFMIIKNK